jgi:magnesium-transporting ATPase (P-type)
MTDPVPQLPQKPVITQEQVYKGGMVGGMFLISVITTFVLWSLLGTESFLPYQGESRAPQTVNILVFIVLFTVSISGFLVIFGTVVYNGWRLLQKKGIEINDKVILAMYVVLVFYLFITLLLHVFKIIHFLFALLSFLTFWGIVGYVQYRRKHRLSKYIPKSNRGREGKDSEQVSG